MLQGGTAGSETYTVTACADGTYQEEWVKPTEDTATACTSCGDEIKSDAVTPLRFPRVKSAAIASGDNEDVEELSVNVRGGSDACCE